MVKSRRSRQSALGSALLVAVLALPGAGQASEREPSGDAPAYGPLPVEDLFSLSLGFLRLSPAAPAALGNGRWELSVVESIGNDFAQSRDVEELLRMRAGRDPVDVGELRALDLASGSDGLFRVDLEHYTTTFGVARGVGAGSRIDVAIPIVDIEGGVLDRTIESFHDLFSLDQAGRTGVPRSDVSLYIRSGDFERVLEGETGKTLGDVRLSFTHDFAPRGPGLAVRGTVKLPTGAVEKLASSGSLDLGLQVLGDLPRGRSHLYASMGLTFLGSHDLLGTTEQWVPSAHLAWERRLDSGSSLLLQLSVADSPFSELGLPELDEPLFEVSVGLRYPLRAGQVFFGFTENLTNFNNSSDVGLSFGLSRAFGRGFSPPTR